MFRPEPELIIFIFGLLSVFAALEHIPDVKRKGSLFKLLFGVGLLTQASAHFFQYNYAVTNQKQVEAETAIALLAFSKGDFSLLEKTSRDPYLVGYWLWKEEKREDAIHYLSQAISQGKYVASSNYLLAVFFSHDENGELKEEFSEAYKHLKRAISNNPDYAPAHYLLAQLYANGKQIAEAIDILPRAVLPDRIGRMPCVDLNAQPQGKKDKWAKIRDHPEFRNLQDRCRIIHGIKTSANGNQT